MFLLILSTQGLDLKNLCAYSTKLDTKLTHTLSSQSRCLERASQIRSWALHGDAFFRYALQFCPLLTIGKLQDMFFPQLWCQCCWVSPQEDNVIHYMSRTSCRASWHHIVLTCTGDCGSPAVSSKNETHQHYFCGSHVRHSLAHHTTTCQQDLWALSPFPPCFQTTHPIFIYW